MNIYKYWGKAHYEKINNNINYHLLIYHCLDVAAVGVVILKKEPVFIKWLETNLRLGREQLIALIAFLLIIHDLGKFSIDFQSLRPEILKLLQGKNGSGKYSVRHDKMGYLAWCNLIQKQVLETNLLSLDKTVDEDDWIEVLCPLVLAVTGHHGKPPDIAHLTLDSYFEPQNKIDALNFTNKVGKLLLGDLQIWNWDEGLSSRIKNLSWVLAGFTILCDWIGSNQNYFPYCNLEMDLADYWHKHALIGAEKALNNLQILPPKTKHLTGMKHLFKEISSPSPLQEYVSTCELENEPQLFIIEEATGSGKTEAAIVLAHRLMAKNLADGLFIALPTMATANAMYKRLEKCYLKMFDEPTSLILAHGNRHLSKEFRAAIAKGEKLGFEKPPEENNYAHDEDCASAQCVSWLADSRKKSLLASVGVGTIDQALLAILPSNHQALRLFGLSSKVLIVDEVHAYDAYMHKLLCNLLEFQAGLGGSAILLSATLPQNMRQDLVKNFQKGLAVPKSNKSKTKLDSSPKYPWITQVSRALKENQIASRIGTERTVKVTLVNSEPLTLIKKLSKEGKCVCWVRNTVDDAIGSYEELLQEIGTNKLILFHARFTMGDRLNIEKDVLKYFGSNSTDQDRCGKVVIATQVVEQSLDLDFDVVISDIAPIDLLIQRLGREKRHPRDEKGNPYEGENKYKEKDKRGEIDFIVYAPKFTLTPQADWYSSFARRAAFVYEKHSIIWLTQKYLCENPILNLPDDARTIINAVYSEEAKDSVFETLQKRDIEAEGKDSAAKAQAIFNGLNLNDGYTHVLSKWVDDTIAPTRLSDPSITLRLARWDGRQLSSWDETQDLFAWDMSQVNVRKSMISDKAPFSKDLAKAYEDLLPLLPDKGKYSLLLPFTKINNIWQTKAHQKDKDVLITYDSKIGLRIEK